MIDISGRTSRTPFAYYDPGTQSLKTSQGTFPLDLPPSSPTLPRSGSMRNGQLFERRTWARPTDGNACSSLLPTPNATVANDGESPATWLARAANLAAKHNNGNGAGTPLAIAVQLLPTPRATDGPNGGPNQRHGNGDRALPSAVLHYLPTPTSRDGKGQNQRGDQSCLHGAIMDPPSTGGSTY